MDWQLVLQGVGFVIGGGVVWVAMQFRNNTKEHELLMEALKDHAEKDGEKLDVLNKNISDLTHELRSWMLELKSKR